MTTQSAGPIKLNQSTIGLAVGLMVIIVMMVLPMPSWVLDFGLATSFAFAILIFTLTLFIEKPLDFSSFPTVLLAALLLRLSLNISSTKLIIGEGHTGSDAAGSVIEGFAMFIMGGNIAIGLIVFCVLVIVNFMVITKGAGRMAEVGARFALDAMPGKQMAIDSDLAAGAISHEEARVRRQTEQEETAFLGSLDGVAKFMKGDAIAGILITILNLIAGLAIGVGIHDVAFSEAIRIYSVLTVGDGLVSQIPAVIISISAGLLLSKGRGEGTVDLALLTQFGAHPSALGAVAGIMVVFAFFPGLPFAPFIIGATILGVFAFLAYQRTRPGQTEITEPESEVSTEIALGDILAVDEINVELARNLISVVMAEEFGFDERVQKIRKYIATEYGFVLPPIRLSDNINLSSNQYRIRIQGGEITTQSLHAEHKLALIEEQDHPDIPGINTREPVFQAPARWVPKSFENELILAGATVIDPIEVVATHLLEIIQDNFPKLLTRSALRQTLETFKAVSDPDRAQNNQKILDEFVPDKVTMDTLQAVCKLLLEERVSIRNIPIILESIAEAQSVLTSTEQVADFVRNRIAYQFVTKYRDEKGQLNLVQIGPEWESTISEHETKDDNGNADIVLTPELFNRLATDVKTQLDKAARQGIYAVIAASTRRRRFLRSVLKAKGLKNPVLSYEEIAKTERPVIIGAA